MYTYISHSPLHSQCVLAAACPARKARPELPVPKVPGALLDLRDHPVSLFSLPGLLYGVCVVVTALYASDFHPLHDSYICMILSILHLFKRTEPTMY